MEENERKYTLVVHKKRIPVSKEVYAAYYHCRDREKYLDELAEKNNISLEACSERGIQVEYLITTAQDSVEDRIMLKDLIARMMESLTLLDKSEQMLIHELFFKGKSERQLSTETGIPQKTINDRKHKVLLKLKKFIET